MSELMVFKSTAPKAYPGRQNRCAKTTNSVRSSFKKQLKAEEMS